MNTQQSTLPFLLDLTTEPSYPPKQNANSQKRPATSNAQIKSGATLRNSVTRPQISQGKSRVFLKTTNSFYKQPYELPKDPETFFCFTELKTMAKPLKKLYSAPQYEALLQKRNSVKERYKRFYQAGNAHTEGAEPGVESPENLKDLILESEKVFNSTYSVKYFGIKDNQLGIVSKRVPMSSFDGKVYGLMTSKQNLQESHLETEDQNKSKNSSPTKISRNSTPWKNVDPSNKHEEDLKSSSRQRVAGQDLQEENSKIKEYQVEDRIEEVTVSEMQNEENMNNENQIDNANESMDMRKSEYYEANNGNLQSMRENQKHMVTHYLIPRRLQTAKKMESGRRTSESFGFQLGVRGHIQDTTQKDFRKTSKHLSVDKKEERNRIWQKVVVEDQKKSNTADFERKVMSLEKTKRALLRNVRVEKAWEAKSFQNELAVPSQFRTYEVNKVLANNAKYSYAQLLKTMYTNERPETAVIENTHKFEKIMIAQEEKQKNTLGNNDKDQINSAKKPKHENIGRYIVKIEYPKQNPMFNRFVKIKSNVESNN